MTHDPLVPPAPLRDGRAVVEQLRARVQSGALGPGCWLRESALAAELGVSRTPVREGLRVLAAEGLIELVPNRGARVLAWTPQEVEETYRLRALLEGEAAALAARRASPAQVLAMEQAQDRYETCIAAQALPRERAACNDAFHAAVLAGAGSPRLGQLLAVLSSAPLTLRAIGIYSDDDVRRSVLQHRDIVTAVREGDDQLAAAAMRSHLLAARYVALRAAPPRAGDDQG